MMPANQPLTGSRAWLCSGRVQLSTFLLMSGGLGTFFLASHHAQGPTKKATAPRWRPLVGAPFVMEPHRTIVRPFLLGCELPGVRIYTTNPGTWAPVWAEWDGHKRRVKSLTSLRGLVRIRSASEALRYARIATTYPTQMGINLYDGPGGMEIDSTVMLPELPTFGITGAISKEEAAHWPFESGQQGILSPAAFRAGGFRTPQVNAVKGGFLIKRWVLGTWESQAKESLPRHAKLSDLTVALAVEFVGRDGSYRRRYTTVKPVPTLPRTRWEGEIKLK